LEYQKQLPYRFPAIFGETEPDEFSKRWGWYDTLYRLANEDITKIKEITTLPITQVFWHLSYTIDRNNKEKNANV